MTDCKTKQPANDFVMSRGVFIIEMFFYAVVDEACRATNVLLIAAATRELVHCK